MSYPCELPKDIKEVVAETVFGEGTKPDQVNWNGVYMLSEFFGIQCNCMGWALRRNEAISIPDKLSNCYYLGEKEGYKKADLSDPNAVIMFWGESDQDILHASRRLSHDQLLREASSFGLTINKRDLQKLVPDPFWSSALGTGYGIITHPQQWLYQGKGVFGPAQGAMK